MLCFRLVSRPPFESGTLCQGDGDHGWGVVVLPRLSPQGWMRETSRGGYDQCT